MNSKFLIPIILIVLILIAVGIYFFSNEDIFMDEDYAEQTFDKEVEGEQEEDENQEGVYEGEVDYLSKIDLEESPFKGDEDAPVVMVNYSSYYCPFCSEFKTDVFPQIEEEYIDTGKVRYVFKDAGNPEDQVFLAAHCAGMQDDLYFEFQSKVYEEGVQTDEQLYEYAKEFDLDVEKFKECIGDACCSYIIEQTQTEMEELNIRGVPHFIINDTELSGAQSFENISDTIEDELAKIGEQ